MKGTLKSITYILLLGVFLSISCNKELECYDCNSNRPPVAIAGVDQRIVIPKDSVRLDGNASTDADGIITNWLWTKVAGPASFTIVNTTNISTTVKNLTAGVYSFELKVTDDKGASARDTVQIFVDNPSANQPPIACAGIDQSIILPVNSVTLDASCSNDPDNNISTYNWSGISGPTTANIADSKALTTLVSGLAQGTYQFELKVTDAGGLSSKDTMKVVVGTTVMVSCGESNRPVINATLIPLGKLSEPGSGMAVASAGNKIVFAGAALAGDPPNYGSSKVNIFDIVTQTWSTATLSTHRTNVSAIAAGTKIFFAGGRLGDGSSDKHYSTVDIYDAANNTWSVANLSQSRAYIASGTVGDKVFFAGGEREWPHPVSDRIDVYDLRANSWSVEYLSAPRSGIAAVTANNKIYFAGGSNQLGGSNHVENIIDIYDNATHSWSTDVLTEPKTFFTGINAHNKIYWSGGYNGAGLPSCKVEVRDLGTQTSATAFLWQPATYVVDEGQNAVLKDNKIIWFTSLEHLTGNPTDKFNIYDIATNKWLIGSIPVKISGASIISVKNTIYVAGGSVNGRMSDQVWKLEF